MNTDPYGAHSEENSATPCDRSFGGFESEDAKAFAAAAHFIRQSVGADAYCSSWDNVFGQEQAQVVKIDPHISEADLEQLPVLSADTSEHKVLMPLVGSRVTKVTWPGVFGQVPIYKGGLLERRNALPSEYLIRQALQIDIFASDIRFEGVSISSKPSMIIGAPAGQPSFVISQGFVTARNADSPLPTEDQIKEFMRESGFEPMPKSYFGWVRAADGAAIVDAKPDNFILSTEGVVPIDLQMAIIPEFVRQDLIATPIIIPP